MHIETLARLGMSPKLSALCTCSLFVESMTYASGAAAEEVDLLLVPEYAYESKSGAEDGNEGEITGPINIAWTRGTGEEVAQFMEGECGWSASVLVDIGRGIADRVPGFSDERYINIGGDGVSQHAEVEDRTATVRRTRQNHIRLYDYNDEGLSLLGQAHHDPAHHGVVPFTDVEGFDRARRAAVEYRVRTTRIETSTTSSRRP